MSEVICEEMTSIIFPGPPDPYNRLLDDPETSSDGETDKRPAFWHQGQLIILNDGSTTRDFLGEGYTSNIVGVAASC